MPRSLVFDEYRVFFDALIQGSGHQVVYSAHSGPSILEVGLERCIDEVCFPLKVFYGHVGDLVSRGVDAVFVPRIISVAQGRNTCPKFHVLPDLVEQGFRGLNVLSPYIDMHHSKREDWESHLFDACRPVLHRMGISRMGHRSVFKKAWKAQLESFSPSKEVQSDSEGVSIAVLGHRYAEGDKFLGVSISRFLEKLGARVLHTPENLPDQVVSLEEDIYYEPSLRTARAAEFHLARGVDGIILLTYFACGPDSYSAETLLYRLERRTESQIPVMRLILDEQTAAEGLITRLETFVDVVRHQKRNRRKRKTC